MTKNNLFKKITVLIAVLLIGLSVCLVPSPITYIANIAKAENSGETIIVSISGINGETVLTPDTSSSVNFVISLSRAVPENGEVTVYYRTRNESAIASVTNKNGETVTNDYDPVDSKVTFFAGDKVARRSVKSYLQTSLAINYTGSVVTDLFETRSFEICIYKVECNNCNAEADANSSSVRAFLRAEKKFNVTTVADKDAATLQDGKVRGYTDGAKIVDSYGNELSFDKQLYYTDYNSRNYSFEVYYCSCDDMGKGSKEFYYYDYKTLEKMMMETDSVGNNLAHGYMGFTYIALKNDAFHCEDENFITIYEKNPNGKYSSDDGTWSMVEDFISEQTDNSWTSFSGADIKEVFLNPTAGDVWIESITSETSSYRDPSTYFNYDGDTVLMRIHTLDVNVEIINPCWYHNKDYDVRFRKLVVDDILPTVVSYTYDNVELTGGDKARISVRFNENVQISQDPQAEKPRVHAKTSGRGSDLYFDYVGGSGTDTLWFEFDMSSYEFNESVKYIQIYGLEGDICDLSMNRAKLASEKYGFTFGSNFVDLDNTEDFEKMIPFDYDFRRPKLSVKNVESTLVKPSKQKTVNLEMTDCDLATVKYAWTRERTDEEYFVDYTNTTTFQNTQSFNESHPIPSPSDITGQYYLYVEVVSPLLISTKYRFGPYVFDNKAPSVSDITLTTDTLTEKTFAFTTKDDTFNVSDDQQFTVNVSDISFVYYESRIIQANHEYENEIKIVENGEIKLSNAVFDRDSSKVSFTLTADNFGLGENGFGYYCGVIRIKDELGNVCDTEQVQYRFDKRNLVDTTISIQGDFITSTLYKESVYNTKTFGITLKVSLTEQSEEDKDGIWSIESVINNGVEMKDSEYCSFDSDTAELNISASFPLGRTEIVFGITTGGTMKISDSYVFYFVGGEEETENEKNLSGNNLIINKVYQLNTYYYYLKIGGGGEVSQNRETYGNAKGNLKPSFSSDKEAFNYVYHNEIQSMYLECISENAATQLNSQTGDSNYSKAFNEKTVAKEGQWWIRYKRISWIVPDNLTDLSGWCYYYYGEARPTEQIDEDRFSAVLKEALNGVANYIVSLGETTWLYGIPSLDESQMHVGIESFVSTKAGSSMLSPRIYYGDGSLYNGTVVYNGKEVWLTTNYSIKVTDNTRIFVAAAYDGNVKEYKEYIIKDGTSFAEIEDENGNKLITGLYSIREIDENGMSEYFVYIDKTEPIVYIDLTSKNADGTYSKTTLRTNRLESNGHVYSARSALVSKIENSELDTFAYICIRKYRTGDIINVYHSEDIDGGLKLEDGYYLIEVCDRSGNYYSFSVRISDDDFKPRIVNEGTQFTIVCDNRSSDQIHQYVIKRNGIDQHVDYTSTYVEKRSGFYEIYIEDIFGNVFNETFDFSKKLPNVQWYYLPEGANSPVPYESDCSEMTMQALSDFTNVINTSRDLSFSFSGDYDFTVENGQFKKDFNVTTRLTMVSLKPTGDMKVTIYYSDTPDVAIIYFCSFDNVAPTVKVTYMATTYRTDDFANINMDELNVGDPVVPTSIVFYEKSVTERPVYSGDTVSAMIFNVSVSDASGVKKAEIFLNDELVSTVTPSGGLFDDFTLNRYGDYKIVAYDVFGNRSTFSFRNGQNENVVYFVDGKEMPYPHGTTFTNDVCNKTEFGGKDQEIVVTSDNEITYIFNVGSQSYFYSYVLENGKLSPRFYTVGGKVDEATSEIIKQLERHEGSSVIISSDEGIKTLVSIDEFTLTAWFVDGNLHLKVTCLTDDELTVMTRVMDSNYVEPFYVQTVLSNKRPTVEFKVGNNGTVVYPTTDVENEGEAVLKTNVNFTLSFDKFDEEKIKSVKIGYSSSSLIESFIDISDGSGLKELWLLSGDTSIGGDVFDGLPDEIKLYYATNENGYYQIIVENVYGNITVYTVIRADGFMVNTVVTYQDLQKTYYDFNYEEKIYSNNNIEFTVYYNGEMESDDVRVTESAFTFVLKKNGEKIREGNLKNGFKLSVEDDGDYVLIISDEYGNEKTLTAQIKKTNLSVNKNAIYGFNENALLKDSGYTNDSLSIKADVINEEEYNFISVTKKGGDTVVLLDLISQNKKLLDENELKDCIGKDGDGEYEIVFRDKFGNSIIVPVTLCFTPTLSLSRTTRSNGIPQSFDLATACEYGFTSNESLMFATTATFYEFKLDGKPYTITQPLTFKSATEETTYIYTVDYVDEYGFKYTFTAKLHREVPKLELNSNVKVVTISGVKYARNNVSYIFDESNATCVYYKDSEQVGVPYKSGTELLLDGSYMFEVTDSAGNINHDVIVKDTVCEYVFCDARTETPIVKGAISNATRVKFMNTGDEDVEIIKILLNGKEVEGFDKDEITESGKWEFILQDAIGNIDYYDFTLVSHALSELKYLSSNGFVVTDAWFTGGNGVRTNYLSYIDKPSDLQSSFHIVEDGIYEFKASNVYTKQQLSFSIIIDNKVPDVALMGCREGETTINDITIKGVKNGDTVKVYKDDKLIQSFVYDGTTLPVISEGGDYKIVVTSVSGISKTLIFTRKHIANTAGSVMIIIAIAAIFTALMIGLVCRTKLKTDE